MIQSLLHDLRWYPVIWRRRLVDYWRFGDRDNVAFLFVFGLPALAAGVIIHVAYLNRAPTGAAGVEGIRREAARAIRREQDLQCLAENIYFESRGEPLEGQYAVAEVTLNRTRAQNFPHTVCEVVHEARWDPARRRLVADFSWTALGEQIPRDGHAWKQAMSVASAVYDDLNEPRVPDALFYHATGIRPGWARTRKVVATIGNHIFYK